MEGVLEERDKSGDLVEDLKIIVPDDKEAEIEIGEKVYNAYDKRDRANNLEAEAVEMLEDEIENRTEIECNKRIF